MMWEDVGMAGGILRSSFLFFINMPSPRIFLLSLVSTFFAMLIRGSRLSPIIPYSLKFEGYIFRVLAVQNSRIKISPSISYELKFSRPYLTHEIREKFQPRKV